MKKNFKQGDVVKLVNLGNDVLDNARGSICGKSIENVWDHYIVRFDPPIIIPNYDYECVAIPEFNLEKVKE